jgi:hypothetical protein
MTADSTAVHVGQVSAKLCTSELSPSLSETNHLSQMFFDTDLAELVEATAPYSTNTMTVTSNDEDSILEEQASTIDPVLEVS